MFPTTLGDDDAVDDALSKDCSRFKVAGNEWTSSLEEVRAQISRAQSAILSDEGGVLFSKTPVQVQAEATDLPRLTLVDLPGIVHTGDGKEAVHNMVKHFADQSSTVILVVKEVNKLPQLPTTIGYHTLLLLLTMHFCWLL